jgi:acyl-CoA thioester hydrolase
MSAFSIRVRVYWEDTDAGGVVFYANYLKFFERARTEWLRSLGFSQRQLRADHALMFVVTDASIAYKAPARLDDEIDVTVAVERTSAATIAFVQQAYLGGALLAQGSVRIACVDAATLAPQRVPDAIARAIAGAITGAVTHDTSPQHETSAA